MHNSEADIINQDQNPFKNYTIIPNIVFELGLSPSALTLYAVLRRIVGFNDSVTWKSTAALAKRCNMSVGQISNAKKELIKHDLIEIRKRDSLKHETDITIIVNIWERNQQHFASQTVHNVNAGFHSTTSGVEKTVHNMNADVNNVKHPNILEEVNNIREDIGEVATQPSQEAGYGTPTLASTLPPTSSHPTIQAFRAGLGKYPNKDKFPALVALVGSNLDTPKLIEAIQAWTLRGYNPLNYAAMVEWYKNGIPAATKPIGFTTRGATTTPADTNEGWIPYPPEKVKVLEHGIKEVATQDGKPFYQLPYGGGCTDYHTAVGMYLYMQKKEEARKCQKN